MTKRTGQIESGELKDFNALAADSSEQINGIVKAVYEIVKDTPIQRLIDSGIVTATDSAISWRTGHLEHIARAYVADPALAWRDYADDLTVALAADGSAFAAAVEAARGE